MRLKKDELAEYGPLPTTHPVVMRVLKVMDGVGIYKHPYGDWACIHWGDHGDEAHAIYKEFNMNHKADYSWMAFDWLVSILHRARPE